MAHIHDRKDSWVGSIDVPMADTCDEPSTQQQTLPPTSHNEAENVEASEMLSNPNDGLLFDFNENLSPTTSPHQSTESNTPSNPEQAKPKPFNALQALTYKPYHVLPIPSPQEPTEQHVQILCHDSPTPFLLPLAPLIKHSRLFALLSQDSSNFASTSVPVDSGSGSTATTTTTTTTTQTLTNIPLDFSAEAFRPFARWLTGGPIAVPRPETDAHGFGTDVYLLMHAHATGEVLMCPVFTDMVMDAIIHELTSSGVATASCNSDSDSDNDSALGADAENPDFDALDRAAKARDLDMLLPAAAAIWPAESLGRQFIVELYAHAAPWRFPALTKRLLLGEGLDGDFVASLLLAVCERRLDGDWEVGLRGTEPWVRDPCRYHVHRREGRGCYRRGRGVGFCELEWVVREAVEMGEGDGWAGTLFNYRDCVDDGGDDGDDV